MSETLGDKQLETPAPPEEIAIRLKAQRAGEEAARGARDMIAKLLPLSTGGMIWWEDDARKKREAGVLHQNGLIDDEELKIRSTPPQRKGAGRGLTIGM